MKYNIRNFAVSMGRVERRHIQLLLLLLTLVFFVLTGGAPEVGGRLRWLLMAAYALEIRENKLFAMSRLDC